MKKILFWMWLLIKRQLKSPAMIAFLVGMPLMCFAVSKMPAMQEEGIPQIALYLQDDDEIAVNAVNRLLQGEYYVEFYVVDSKEALYSDVESGKADHGYLFKPDFEEKLDNVEYDGSVEVVQSAMSGSIISMTKEVVFAEIFRVYGMEIVKDYANTCKAFKGRENDAADKIAGTYKKYAESKDTFHIDFEELTDDGQVTELESAKVVFPIRGVIAILVFVAGLYGGVWWKQESRQGVFKAMPLHLAKASRFLYVLVPTALFAISAEVSLLLTHTADYPSEFGVMLCYIAAITFVVTVLTALVPDEKIMVSIIPLIAIACIVVCPVFVNVGGMSRVLKYVRMLFLPYYYIIM